MNDYDAGRLSVSIDIVKRGVRDVSHLALRVEDVPDAAKTVADAGLYYHSTVCGLTHIDFHVLVDPRLGRILAQAEKSPQHLRDWVYGKLLGYSTKNVLDFIEEGWHEPPPRGCHGTESGSG